jgi:hypothetical protein
VNECRTTIERTVKHDNTFYTNQIHDDDDDDDEDGRGIIPTTTVLYHGTFC